MSNIKSITYFTQERNSALSILTETRGSEIIRIQYVDSPSSDVPHLVVNGHFYIILDNCDILLLTELLDYTGRVEVKGSDGYLMTFRVEIGCLNIVNQKFISHSAGD